MQLHAVRHSTCAAQMHRWQLEGRAYGPPVGLDLPAPGGRAYDPPVGLHLQIPILWLLLLLLLLLHA